MSRKGHRELNSDGRDNAYMQGLGFKLRSAQKKTLVNVAQLINTRDIICMTGV